MLELKVSLAMCSSLELGGGNGLQSIGAAELESAILINISVGFPLEYPLRFQQDIYQDI